MFVEFASEQNSIYYVFQNVELVHKKSNEDEYKGSVMLVVNVSTNSDMLAVSSNSEYIELDLNTPANSYYEFKTMLEYSFDIVSYNDTKLKWNIRYSKSIDSRLNSKKRKSSEVESSEPSVHSQDKEYTITKILSIFKDGFLCECKYTDGPRHFKFNKVTNLGIVYE